MEVTTDIHALHQRLKVPPRTHIQKLVLLVGSSRGGTSHLFHLLQRSMELLTPRAEELPFTKLYLPGTGTNDSARDWSVAGQADIWWEHLGCDVGVGEPGWAGDWDTYPEELAMRLPMQWPHLAAEDVLTTARSSKYPPNQMSAVLHLPGVDKRYYDGAHVEGPLGPPRLQSLIEEPPFIKPLPRWRDWGKTTLLLKSSVNAYRIQMFPQLFNSQLQLIHLVRNPAAAVNGLMDGWLWHGFFSRNVGDLAITGYSDVVPWGREWWNFDLPPGWDLHRIATLAEVCAFQWASAHAAIVNATEETDTSVLRVEYEDLLEQPEETIQRLCAALDIKDVPYELMPVMATKEPQRGRWKARREVILNALKPYEDICADLGYPLREASRWP